MKVDFSHICLYCMNFTMKGSVCAHCGTGNNFTQNYPNALPPGTILVGKYLLGRVLGCGGFGITYLAMDIRLKRIVAIKEYMPNRAGFRTKGSLSVSTKDKKIYDFGLERFYSEAAMVSRLSGHPNIVRVYEVFSANRTAYFAMEYLKGESLESRRRRTKIMSYEDVCSLLLPVLDALEYIHDRHVIHRDISPDNIFLSSQTKLIDFGAARVESSLNPNLTVLLKKGYAPVEQYFSAGKQGPWTDIYAMAATMYVCLSGEEMPPAPERQEHDTLPDIRKKNADVPDYAAAAIMQALKMNWEERFRNVKAFHAALTGNKIFFQSMSFQLRCVQGFYKGAVLKASDNIVIGKDPHCCQLVFPGNLTDISAVHCMIRLDKKRNQIILEDLHSQYGTQVKNIKRLYSEKMTLNSGDWFVIGNSQTFQINF